MKTEDSKNEKVRVNMFVDLDVIERVRRLAAAEHMPYQTWINRKLRDLVEGRLDSGSPSPGAGLTADDVARLVDERLEKRVDKMVLKRL